ncbi:MAG: CinA family protein [Proteobacteria bacterium]|nr:CinA family protein [Pseudomonadota bacterium]
MQELLGLAERIGAKLKARKETVAVAESSAGGLVSAALLSVPGASAYFLGGSVIYTRQARRALLGIGHPLPEEVGRASTEAYARLLASTMRESVGAVWGVGETGATGPSGNSYGDAPGHSCIAIAGPAAKAITLETGSPDRVANMRAFARRALELLDETLT